MTWYCSVYIGRTHGVDQWPILKQAKSGMCHYYSFGSYSLIYSIRFQVGLVTCGCIVDVFLSALLAYGGSWRTVVVCWFSILHLWTGIECVYCMVFVLIELNVSN